MELYIKVQFWILLFSIVVHLIRMSITDYPRTETFKVGFEAAVIIEKVLFMLWAAWLVFGSKL